MRIAVVTKHARDRRHAYEEAARYGFTKDEERPRVVLCYGGDGTLLHAERRYPRVAKVAVRLSERCNTCHTEYLDHALEAVARRRCREERLMRLEATARTKKGSERLVGINDVNVRNKRPTSAIRFSLLADKRLLYERVIGDGIVVATPFGSTAYYRSITKESFENGLGVALNNTTGDEVHVRADEDVVFTLRVTRGPAEVAVDNQRMRLTLEAGDRLTVKRRKGDSVLLRPPAEAWR